MNLIKEDGELLLVQCNLCKKEFNIKKEKCSKTKEGYELNEQIRCDNCGQEDNSIIDYKNMLKIYNVRDKRRNLQTFEKEKRIEEEKNRIKELEIQHQIKCPNCKTTNVKKISGLSKAGSVALFGIFSLGKLNKTYECNKCGYRW